MSSFKIKLLKALKTTNTPPIPPQKEMLKSGWIISDSDSTTLTSMGQGEGLQWYQIHGIGIL